MDAPGARSSPRRLVTRSERSAGLKDVMDKACRGSVPLGHYIRQRVGPCRMLPFFSRISRSRMRSRTRPQREFVSGCAVYTALRVTESPDSHDTTRWRRFAQILKSGKRGSVTITPRGKVLSTRPTIRRPRSRCSLPRALSAAPPGFGQRRGGSRRRLPQCSPQHASQVRITGDDPKNVREKCERNDPHETKTGGLTGET